MMDFYFDSFDAFMWMDGHGPYVWACYIVTLIVFAGLVLAPRLRRAKFVKQQRALAARRQAKQEVVNNESR